MDFTQHSEVCVADKNNTLLQTSTSSNHSIDCRQSQGVSSIKAMKPISIPESIRSLNPDFTSFQKDVLSVPKSIAVPQVYQLRLEQAKQGIDMSSLSRLQNGLIWQEKWKGVFLSGKKSCVVLSCLDGRKLHGTFATGDDAALVHDVFCLITGDVNTNMLVKEDNPYLYLLQVRYY
jgi:hypothetical protein